ncbi:MAG: sigma-70 family RNA polymerase sigma factor, partial [Myxococcota bacterium]
ALRGLPRFKPNARLSTWLLTIATRTALDQLRRNRRRDGEEPPEAFAEPRLDARFDAARLRDRVMAEMAALPDDQRAALVLRAFHDLDYPEIAAALEVEVGTVKSRIGRAREALRRATEEPRNE